MDTERVLSDEFFRRLQEVDNIKSSQKICSHLLKVSTIIKKVVGLCSNSVQAYFYYKEVYVCFILQQIKINTTIGK